jgi:hypothetical protein
MTILKKNINFGYPTNLLNTSLNMSAGETKSIPLQGILSDRRREFKRIGTTDSY